MAANLLAALHLSLNVFKQNNNIKEIVMQKACTDMSRSNLTDISPSCLSIIMQNAMLCDIILHI